MKLILNFVVALLLIVSCKVNNDRPYKEYYPDGTIKTEAQAKDGMRNGISKYYDEKGRLESTKEFVNDTLEGLVIKYNTADGKVTIRTNYHKGIQEGPLTQYYQGGALYRESYYKEGRIDSVVKTYWPDGKIQAEGFYKMGMPSIDFKEYDKKGNLVKQPKIIIEEINHLAFDDQIELKIYLSNHDEKAKFYLGYLKDEKFLDTETERIFQKEGIASLKYYVPRHSSLIKKLTFIVRCNTEYGNELILVKSYNLAVSH